MYSWLNRTFSYLTGPVLISETVITELQYNSRFPILKFFGYAKPSYGVTGGGKVGYVFHSNLSNLFSPN